MATVTIITESVQGSMPTPSGSVSVPGGAVRPFTVNILSSTWATVGTGVDELDILIQKSIDGGVTWNETAYAHVLSGATKGGGLPSFGGSWDGVAGLVRIGHILTTVSGASRYTYDSTLGQTATVVDHGGSDPTFTWGLSVTV